MPRPWSSSRVLTSGLSLLALPLLWGVPPASAQSSWGYTYNVTAGMLSKAWNAVVEPLGACGVGVVCRWRLLAETSSGLT